MEGTLGDFRMSLAGSHLVDMDEEPVGLFLWVDDPTFGPLSLQNLLELKPLALEGGISGCGIWLQDEHRES